MAPNRNIVVQPRDLDLLCDLFESRIFTLAQISKIHFDGRAEMAKKRVFKLKQAGLIAERKRHVNEPSILFLARPGFDLLRVKGLLNGYPEFTTATLIKRANVSAQTVDHELEVADVRVAISCGIFPTVEFSISEFVTWPLLVEFAVAHPVTRKEMLVKPDGFFRVHEKESDGLENEHAFFLEVDRSTEAIERLVEKAQCYLAYYNSGGYAHRNGALLSDYRNYPFRVLIVAKTAERRNNLALRLLEAYPPILTHTWLTTLSEVLGNPLGPIWVCPADYRGFAEREQSPSFRKGEYRRNIARDDFLESTLTKRGIFEDG